MKSILIISAFLISFFCLGQLKNDSLKWNYIFTQEEYNEAIDTLNKKESILFNHEIGVISKVFNFYRDEIDSMYLISQKRDFTLDEIAEWKKLNSIWDGFKNYQIDEFIIEYQGKESVKKQKLSLDKIRKRLREKFPDNFLDMTGKTIETE